MTSYLAKSYASPLDAPQETPKLVKWTSGLANCVVLNVGSVKGNPNREGFRGCFRSDLGQWMVGSLMTPESCNWNFLLFTMVSLWLRSVDIGL